MLHFHQWDVEIFLLDVRHLAVVNFPLNFQVESWTFQFLALNGTQDAAEAKAHGRCSSFETGSRSL